MKTNFLYFRHSGAQTFVATAGQTAFTIKGAALWDVAVTADTQVKVTVTDVSAGTTSVYGNSAKSLANTNDITIAAQGVGDIVTIELIPTEGTEACFRADRLLAVNSTSDTVTVLKFKASNGAAADDTITLTHPDNDGAEFKVIADYVHQVCNANITERGNVITVSDRQNDIVGRGLQKAGVTKMVIAIA